MGGMSMIMAIVAPLTCPAHQVTEVGKVRGIGAEMTVSHLDTTHEDQYEAELLHCYKGLIHDQGGH